MSKNFLKKENIYVGKKKNAYIGFSIFFILLIITAYIYTIYLNKSIIDNSKTVHYSNLELNEKISFLKEKLKEKNIKIKKYKEDNQELSSMFNKYTDAIKFKIATAEEIKYSLFIKDEQILKLNKEINYYKFLLNSKNKNDLVSIENFKIDLHEKDNSLNYSVLLLSNDSNSKIRGSFKFYYDGVVKNTENKIFRNYIEIKNKKISFKNYQILSGNMKLPNDHIVKVLYLDVKCNGKLYNYKHAFSKF